MGRIGITFCPGKVQPTAMTGGWSRDLGLDVDAIAAWGASAVVTLVEDHELKSLKVEGLGDAVRRRHMDWYHLPIVDVSTPCSRFETEWDEVGEGLRARLRDGFDLVVHCKGGLGRAGTIAARLLVELGADPADAIREVRTVRPGALETHGQVDYVLGLEPISEHRPDTSQAAIEDRALGALLGLAVGDAVGTTLEFQSRDSYPPLTDMVGGGPFRLKAGQWTDDTAMALALAESLIACDGVNERDLMQRFCDWRTKGDYSCTGTCFDIGNTIGAALSRFERTGNPLAGSPAANMAGNGSLMRLSPVALRYWLHPDKLRDAAARQSLTTHGAPEAVDACIAYAAMVAEAIAGEPRSQVLRPRESGYAGKIRTLVGGSWRGAARADIGSSGYVAHSLEAALWSIGRTSDFRSAVLVAANLGGDTDTTAAIAGQLAGAIYGKSGIPAEWLAKLAWRERIEVTGRKLIAAGAGSASAQS